MKDVDAFLLGRRTYVTHADGLRADAGRRLLRRHDERAEEVRRLARRWRSRCWRNTTIIRDNVVEAVRALKAQPGRNILTDGSSQLVHALLEHDLVDELHLLVYPLTLGSGKRLLPSGVHATLRSGRRSRIRPAWSACTTCASVSSRMPRPDIARQRLVNQGLAKPVRRQRLRSWKVGRGPGAGLRGRQLGHRPAHRRSHGHGDRKGDRRRYPSCAPTCCGRRGILSPPPTSAGCSNSPPRGCMRPMPIQSHARGRRRRRPSHPQPADKSASDGQHLTRPDWRSFSPKQEYRCLEPDPFGGHRDARGLEA